MYLQERLRAHLYTNCFFLLACFSLYYCALRMTSSIHYSYMLLHLFLLPVEFSLLSIFCFSYDEKYLNVWSLSMFFTNVNNWLKRAKCHIYLYEQAVKWQGTLWLPLFLCFFVQNIEFQTLDGWSFWNLNISIDFREKSSCRLIYRIEKISNRYLRLDWCQNEKSSHSVQKWLESDVHFQIIS